MIRLRKPGTSTGDVLRQSQERDCARNPRQAALPVENLAGLGVLLDSCSPPTRGHASQE